MRDAFYVGDSLDFGRSVPAYPATDGWTLKYRMVPRVAGVGSVIELTASADGADYRIQASPVTTATWTAAEYSAFAEVEKNGAKHIVYPTYLDGTPAPALWTLLPDPRIVEAYDGRSTARKILDQLDAVLVSWSSGGPHIEEYEIAGRRVRYADRPQLITWRSQLKAEVWREESAEAMANGSPNPRMIGVRFGRA